MKQSKLYVALGTALLLTTAPGWILAQTPEPQPTVQVLPETQVETPTTASNLLYTMTADELKGRLVNNIKGEKLGEIDNIVIDTQDNTLKAVVSVGGLLGIGEKDIVVSLDQLQISEGGSLMLATDMTEDQLKAAPEYKEDLYQDVAEDDVALSQFQDDVSPSDASDAAPPATNETPANNMPAPETPANQGTTQ